MSHLDIDAQREKNAAALMSVFAAIALTAFKLIVGLTTNSLGILAEAAHSLLDLIAAGVTLFAVRWAGKPPDREHPFGHGKMENLSALFETLLLAVTALFIIYQAVIRLLADDVQVDVTVWSYLVVAVAIVVDFSRSRVLMRAAKKHHSQALEADALHFSTDIWSSAVVFVGLLGVWLADRLPRWGWLVHADALAAIMVALIVLYVSWGLGKRTVAVLLDTAPSGMADDIAALTMSVPDVLDCHLVRVRPAGASWFVDMHVRMRADLSLESSHARTEEIEAYIRARYPGADVMVHVEPQR